MEKDTSQHVLYGVDVLLVVELGEVLPQVEEGVVVVG